MDESSEQKDPINLDDYRSSKNASEQKPSIKAGERVLPEVIKLSSLEYSQFLWDEVKSETPEETVPIFSQIAGRLETEIEKANDKDPNSVIYAHNIGLLTSELVKKVSETDPSVKVDPQALDTLYELSKSDNPNLRYYADEYIDKIIVLDNRNGDQRLNLLGRLRADIVQKSVSQNSSEDWQIAEELIDVANESFPHMLGDYLIASMEATNDSSILTRIFSKYAELMDFNVARETLLTRAREDPEFSQKLNGLERIQQLHPHSEGKIHANQEDFYSEMDEKSYVSYATPFDLDFLRKHTKPDDIILDQAAGDGRLVIPISNERKVSAGDLTSNHVRAIKEALPQNDIRQESWDSTSWQDGNFDVVYVLGRSVATLNTLPKWRNFLEENARITKPNGKILLDLPDVNSPFYKKNIEDLEGRLRRLGITNWLKGSVIDSPNKKDFTDRFLPSHDQMVAIAKLNGFDARIVASNGYEAPNGENATNLYYELVKSSESLSREEEARVLRIACGIEEVPTSGTSEYDKAA